MDRKFFGFYFAILVALFNATGVSATVNPDLFSDQNTESSEKNFISSDAHQIWASEEVFQLIKLPEYSENHFFGSAFFGAPDYLFHDTSLGHYKPCGPQCDPKTLITSLIFPFHFFL